MPTDLALTDQIVRLRAQRAVELFRALLRNEVEAAGPRAEFHATSNATAPDEGIDGRSRLPRGTPLPLPSGKVVWQVKSGRAQITEAFVRGELDKPGVRRALREGWHYCLFATKDPSDSEALRIRDLLRRVARRRHPRARTFVLFASDIERLVTRRPALYPYLGVPVGSFVDGPTWMGRSVDIEYVPDPRRTEQISTLIAFLTESRPRVHCIHVFGDAGVGKTRLVQEAVRAANVDVLCCSGPDTAVGALLARAAQVPRVRLSLIVDDCSDLEGDSYRARADLADGRVRLITIGTRTNRFAVQDHASLEVLPLQVASAESIARAAGVANTELARAVAEVTEGYPRLTRELAASVAMSRSGADLLQLIRGREVLRLLERMLPDHERRTHLGVLALFRRIGYSGGRSREVESVCNAFGLDLHAFKRTCEEERGKYVSQGVVYWNITPLLFGFWLAEQVLRERRTSVLGAIRTLDNNLWEAFSAQVQRLGAPSSLLSELREVLDVEGSFRGSLRDLSPRDAELLQAVAVSAPAAVGSVLSRVIASTSLEELRSCVEVRRALVWTLDELLWHPETAEEALRAMARFAEAENETYANNATGRLKELFHVHLSGTCLAYERRLEVCNELLAVDPRGAGAVLVAALGGAFELHESRGGEPTHAFVTRNEWRPARYEEEHAARIGAVRILMAAASEPDLEVQAAEVFASGLYVLATRACLPDAYRALRPPGAWSVAARKKLWTGARATLWHVEADETTSDAAETVREQARSLLSDIVRDSFPRSLSDRAAVIFGSPWWGMVLPGSYDALPEELTAFVGELVLAPVLTLVELLVANRDGDAETAWQICIRVGEQRPTRDVLDAALTRGGISASMVEGLVAGASRAGATWVDSELESWCDIDDRRGWVISVIQRLGASDRRAEIAIRAATLGASVDELGGFMYGAWLRDSQEDTLVRVVSLLLRKGSERVKSNALAILDQWTDQLAQSPSRRVRGVVRRALRVSAGLNERSGMTAHLRRRLVAKASLTPLQQSRLVMDALEARASFPSNDDLEVLGSASGHDPRRVCRFVVKRLARAEADRRGRMWSSWARSGHLLSVLEEHAGVAEVFAAMHELGVDQAAAIMVHYDFSGTALGQLPLRWLASTTSERMAKAIRRGMLNPGTVISGSLAEYYGVRAASMRALASQATSARVRAWARETARAIGELAAGGQEFDEEYS